MTAEWWLVVVIAVAVVAAIAGFLGGRASAPSERRVRQMEQERDAARAEAGQVQSEVARHFEESARMFGRLADDYRTFFEHFARTAQNLGMSEGRARALLHEADPRLVEAGEAVATGGTSGAGAASSTAPPSEADIDDGAASDADAAASSRSGEGAAAGEAGPESAESAEHDEPAAGESAQESTGKRRPEDLD